MEKTVTVTAGSVGIGDTLNGGTVVRLGSVRVVRVTDDTACAYGMEPGQDWYPILRRQDVTVRS